MDCRPRRCTDPKWIDAHLPAELFRQAASNVDGIVIHRDSLDKSETSVVRGIPVTTPARTAYDLGRRGTVTQAVIRLDALANATDLKPRRRCGPTARASRRSRASAVAECDRSDGRRRGVTTGDAHEAAPHRRRIPPARNADRGVRRLRRVRRAVSTWDIGSGRSPSSTTVDNTGMVPMSMLATSRGLLISKRKAGRHSAQSRHPSIPTEHIRRPGSQRDARQRLARPCQRQTRRKLGSVNTARVSGYRTFSAQ